MKNSVLVAAFVLVACVCIQAHAAAERAVRVAGKDGKKDVPCPKIPDDIKSKCVSYQCDKKNVTIKDKCPETKCPKGQVAEKGPESLTKKFPDCCPKVTCRAEKKKA